MKNKTYLARYKAATRVAIATTILFAAAMLAVLSPARAESELTDAQRKLNVESFDYVWTRIQEKHFDPALGGLDWPAIRDKMRPHIEAANTMDEARRVLQELVSSLGLSHFAIISRDLYENIHSPDGTGGGDGDTGIDVRSMDGHAVIVSVRGGSPAEEAGIRPGWEIEAIEGDSVAPLLKKVTEKFSESTVLKLYLAAVIQSRLQGAIGDSLQVTFIDGDGHIVEQTVGLTAQKGEPFRLGLLPLLHAWIDTRTIDDTIGYIAFNGFFDPVNLMPVFNKTMESYLQKDGVIIDLRGNGGGIVMMAMGMAGWVVSEKKEFLGTLYTRDTELKLIIPKRPRVFAGPVAILVDGLSASASEFFAGGLQGIGRASVFGTRTAGAALPSAVEELPNGDTFQYVIGNYISKDGTVLEGRGVVPDKEVAQTREGLLAGRDLVIEAAVDWIRQQQ